MSDVNHYHTIGDSSVAEFRDRGSRFIAFAFPLSSVSAFKEKLASLKKEHPKANHHCFAYRIGTDGNNYRASDDGEPSGTAGRPILGQIDSRQLTNVLIIVVRYFGGTLLGVPGLINAYRTVTAEVLDRVVIIQKPVLIHLRLQFDYTRMNDVMRWVKQNDCVILKQEMQLFCIMEIGLSKDREGHIIDALTMFPGLEIEKI